MKKIAPTTGTSDRPGIVHTGSVVIEPDDESPSPRTRARPVPRNVRARPDTTWSARRWIVITPCSRLKAPPASIAMITPSQGFPVEAATENPATAPISIIPSTPRFRTPDRSAKISPIAAKSRMVPDGDAGGQDRRPVHQVVTIGRTMRTR